MTWVEAANAVARRWPIALVGVLITVVALVVVHAAPTVYHSESKVLLLIPKSTRYPNGYAATTGSLAAVAGIVSKAVGGVGGGARTSSPSVTLLGEGVEDGWSVLQPNRGGQWAIDYEDPYLLVEATGPTSEIVMQRQAYLVQRIESELTALQDQAGVEQVNRIRPTLSPPVPSVFASKGSGIRALAATLGLGLGLTVSACVILDARIRRRRVSQAA